MTVKDLFLNTPISKNIKVQGWVKTFRANRFISLNDGSTFKSIQCVVDFENTDNEILNNINSGASVEISGILVESLGKGQKIEIKVTEIKILGKCDPEDYPIQPKKHSLEFLRENAHLRIRTNTFSSIFRIRSSISYAIHKYFKESGFVYVNTPIITGSDAEGAGEMFKVTTLDINNAGLDNANQIDYSKDFFGKETNLTVSGQLEAESMAMALGNVYTFGPTFRAENSNTSRHLAEFWMVEPEMAFCDLQSEHERFLVEKHFKKPVIIHDYPAKIKAFYMRMNEDGKTVRAMDILFPGIGEIVGGSQREERLNVLKERISELNIDEKELWWYLDLRKYGSVKHSGFGLGLERLILFATGMSNIRDVIPFPRTPKNAEF